MGAILLLLRFCLVWLAKEENNKAIIKAIMVATASPSIQRNVYIPQYDDGPKLCTNDHKVSYVDSIWYHN